ncbi:Rho GTPase-activating protein [Arachis hypogaea]|nr:Rho GTPase-activating protein [Arachis hypogaea]
MTSKTDESVQENDGAPNLDPQPQPESQTGSPEHPLFKSSSSTKVFKSGPLFISSKGIGWTSWKKRWFVLTQTSLVFFRSDPVSSFFLISEIECNNLFYLFTTL